MRELLEYAAVALGAFGLPLLLWRWAARRGNERLYAALFVWAYFVLALLAVGAAFGWFTVAWGPHVAP